MEAKSGRYFFGVELSDRAREDLKQQLLVAGVRLHGQVIPVENWHITLLFLGSIDQTLCQTILEEAATLKFGDSFEVLLSGFGAFPNPKQARIWWVGVKDDHGPLKTLESLLRNRMRKIGVPLRNESYVPHLTLSKLRNPLDLSSDLDPGEKIKIQSEVNRIVLYESVRENGLSIYKLFRSYGLRRT